MSESLTYQAAQAPTRDQAHRLALAPVLAVYASMDPQALWQAGGATAPFIAAFGAAGYATRRDLTQVARVSFWAVQAGPTPAWLGFRLNSGGHLLGRAVITRWPEIPAA